MGAHANAANINMLAQHRNVETMPLGEKPMSTVATPIESDVERGATRELLLAAVEHATDIAVEVTRRVFRHAGARAS